MFPGTTSVTSFFNFIIAGFCKTIVFFFREKLEDPNFDLFVCLVVVRIELDKKYQMKGPVEKGRK